MTDNATLQLIDFSPTDIYDVTISLLLRAAIFPSYVDRTCIVCHFHFCIRFLGVSLIMSVPSLARGKTKQKCIRYFQNRRAFADIAGRKGLRQYQNDIYQDERVVPRGASVRPLTN